MNKTTSQAEITVEVIFALEAESLWRQSVSLPQGATIEMALVRSGFYQNQEKQWHDAPCGIFGVQQPRDYVLANGDQVEVYRSLRFDPMESRRRRAAHKAKVAQQKHQDEARRRQPSAAARMILNQ